MKVSSIDVSTGGQVPTPAFPAAGRAPQPNHPLSRGVRTGLFLHRGLDKWLAPLGIWIIRRTKGGIARSRMIRMLGAPRDLGVLLLTTRGRRSGRERTVVLQFFGDGDAMVVAAANGGGAAHPGWYLNLKGDPSARVEVMGRTTRVRAEELPGDAAADWWRRIVAIAPSYERYARATSRTFPIVRLVPTL